MAYKKIRVISYIEYQRCFGDFYGEGGSPSMCNLLLDSTGEYVADSERNVICCKKTA